MQSATPDLYTVGVAEQPLRTDRSADCVETMLNLLPSILILGLAAFVAVYLVRTRRSPAEYAAERLAAARVLALTAGVQGIHFTEEAAAGLHEQLPALFGLPSIPLAIFLVFNVMWLVIWAASVPGLRTSRAGAFFAAWFLAIAGIFNGIVHPLLAILAGGYFPGLVSSPFIGAASVWLWRRLHRATVPT